MIETERLYIVNATEADIETIINLEKDKENFGYIWCGTYKEHKAEIEDKNHRLFVFRRKEDNLIVGYALIKLDLKSQTFELQSIATSCKKIGYGREVMVALLKYAFEKKGFNCFSLEVYPYNLVGIKFYEELGMHPVEVFAKDYKFELDCLDEIIYSMLKNEYFERYKSS